MFCRRVNVLSATGEPAGLLKRGEVPIEHTAALAREMHEIEAVAWSVSILKKYLKQGRHRWCQLDISNR
jgi:hypothetical protein